MPAAAMSELRGRVYSQLAQNAVWEQSYKLFEQIDQDGSGTLDVAELQHGAEARFGTTFSEKQVREMCAKVGNGNDGLNRQQLMTFLSMLLGVKSRSASTMSELRGARYTQTAQKAVWEQSHRLFVQFDQDESGTLDVAELQHGAAGFGTTLSEKQVREMCAKIGNGNAGLNRQQLMTFLSMLLGVEALEKPKNAEFRARVYDIYAKYSVDAIRQAALGEAKVNGTQEVLETRSADLAPIKPNEYKSLPEGYARGAD